VQELAAAGQMKQACAAAAAQEPGGEGGETMRLYANSYFPDAGKQHMDSCAAPTPGGCNGGAWCQNCQLADVLSAISGL